MQYSSQGNAAGYRCAKIIPGCVHVASPKNEQDSEHCMFWLVSSKGRSHKILCKKRLKFGHLGGGVRPNRTIFTKTAVTPVILRLSGVHCVF